MILRLIKPTVTLLSAVMLAGCIAVPIPIPPGGEVHDREDKIDDLINKAASREDVIAQLGSPLKYRKTSMSYKACREGTHLGIFVLTIGAFDYNETTGDTECFEIILQFNNANHLTSYETIKWQHGYDVVAEEMMLFELASQGDELASKLLEKMTYYTSDTGARSLNYEIGTYCPNADLGHADAQKRIGDIYYSSTLVKSDLVRAYVWYRLAVNGGNRGAAVRLRMAIEKLTSDQISEAEQLLNQWKPGQCEADLLEAKSIRVSDGYHPATHDLSSFLAEQGSHEAQYQLYNRVQTRSERLMWLCRAADSGSPLAQAEVGRVYRWGLYGVEQNYKKAYQWYWLANNQAPDSWEDELNDAKQMATSTELQPLSEAIVNGLQSGQCEREILSGNDGY